MYRLEALKVPLKDAIASSALDSHKYLVNMAEDYCYGKSTKLAALSRPPLIVYPSCT